MDTTESMSSIERLKQHFASRVLNQSRQLIDLWQLISAEPWSNEPTVDLVLQIEKLLSNAKRFGAGTHLLIANELLRCFASISPSEPPSASLLSEINSLFVKLSHASLRRSDGQVDELPCISQKPIYLALPKCESTELVAKQMRSFRLYPKLVESSSDLLHCVAQRRPAALVLDVDFDGDLNGLALAEQLQADYPIVFSYHNEAPSLEQQLLMMRNSSIGMFHLSDVHAIINKLEHVLEINPEPAYKVLVVDDSRAQALHTANTLRNKGIECEMVNDPLLVFDALQSFDPDLVLMDMYMPRCTGVELARVIRQQREYINLPIIYLSGEEDKERQLQAMSEAGDDFLTKPVESRHLLITINNRISRARQLQNLIARDSLTGLLNHTHTLTALQTAMNRHPDTPISFAMLDIDHFKQVNDTYGHPVGDNVIRNLSLFLRQHLRNTDPIGRYGGEEFAVVLVGADEEQAIHIMDSIRAGFAELIHDNKTLTATFSCGVAQWHGESLSELVSLADQALYVAKREGRNQVSGASSLSS